ncbi:MAG TPA: sugar phosphate nucleotidyltransferase [Candidatus Saccharimonadia bacterium]
MIIVIIAGGSGTRLWPLSVGSYPKHLLKLTGDRSGVQVAYDRAKLITDKIYVVTEQSHAHHVKEQLPGVPEERFIIEPGRRGTASCIVAALERVSRDHPTDEPVGFNWADHFIRDVRGFARAFKLAGEQSKKYRRITLVGVEPTHPSVLFGYIEKGDTVDSEAYTYAVAQFKEKPELKVAKKFYESGKYLWNSGYLVGSVDVFLEAMEKFSPERFADFKKLAEVKDDTEAYNQAYLGFENDAIDYALNEKVDNLMVMPATFDWRDVGSFGDLYEVGSNDEQGNVISGAAVHTIEAENSFIRNDEDKPVAVIGLDNVVVVNTPHGILVSRKDISQKVKEIVKRLEAEDQAKPKA